MVRGFVYLEHGIADGARISVRWGVDKVIVPEIFPFRQHVYAKTTRYKAETGRVYTYLGRKDRL